MTNCTYVLIEYLEVITFKDVKESFKLLFFFIIFFMTVSSNIGDTYVGQYL